MLKATIPRLKLSARSGVSGSWQKNRTSAARKPVEESNPRKKAGKASKHLTPAKKKAAKASAKRAGRPYPNLVDNMRAPKEKSRAKRSRKKSHEKDPTKKRRREETGRKKSGRKKSQRKRSVARRARRKRSARRLDRSRPSRLRQERRLASQARRAQIRSRHDAERYAPQRQLGGALLWPGEVAAAGRCKNGQPTRHALSAHAWGEPVPKTVAAARRIAEKASGCWRGIIGKREHRAVAKLGKARSRRNRLTTGVTRY